MLLLSTAYLGNIQYYSKLASGCEIVIEAHENYQKQSYRNRCDIMAANGIISLVIPVLKGSSDKIPIRDVRIDHRTAWERIHSRSIMSAYSSSPFYEFYADDIMPFYEHRYDFLFDFNMELQSLILRFLKINPTIHLSEEYRTDIPIESDFRNSISPKTRLQQPDPAFEPPVYSQVFEDRFGFIPNLSIIDLLFAEGPTAQL